MGQFTSDEISRVVFALVGDIKPIGDAAHNMIPLENVETLIKIAKDIHLGIDRLANKYYQSKYYSERRVGELCVKYLDWLGKENKRK